MTTTAQPVAGCTLWIAPTGAAPTSPDQWTQIKNIVTYGGLGTEFTTITVESVDDGYTRQLKGTQKSADFPIVMNRIEDDPGQIALKAAALNQNDLYNFKLIENDKVTTNGAPTVTVWKGRVSGFYNAYGGVNDVKKVNSGIYVEPDTIVITAAT